MDPGWTESPWFYEDSSTENLIPGSLHAKQNEALAAEHKHRWLFWGNQVGKSTCGAVDCVLLALGRHPDQRWEPGVTIWASALTWDMWEQILLPELLTWIPRDRLIEAPPAKQKSTKRTILIRADNGQVSRIIGKSAEQGPGKYQSARVHQVWFDEEHPEAIYDEVLPRLLRFGGRTINTMTPLLGLTWVYHRIYEPTMRMGGSRDHYISHAGLADNPGISSEEIEALKRELAGNPQQLAARLHGKFMRSEGLVIKLDHQHNLQSFKAADVRRLIQEQGWKIHGGIDFGSWRFSFILGAVDRAGRLWVMEEMFSQRETLEVRARKIDALLNAFLPPSTKIQIRGDAANPTDIAELNATFQRLNMPWRVSAVANENKARDIAAQRINNLLARRALVIRREIGHGARWKLGQSAARDGREVVGSRLLYEIGAWAYPKPKPGEVQVQDPDDATADGADMIAALRYMVMSILRPPKPKKVSARERLQRLGGDVSSFDFGFEDAIANHVKQRQQRLGRRGFN